MPKYSILFLHVYINTPIYLWISCPFLTLEATQDNDSTHSKDQLSCAKCCQKTPGWAITSISQDKLPSLPPVTDNPWQRIQQVKDIINLVNCSSDCGVIWKLSPKLALKFLITPGLNLLKEFLNILENLPHSFHSAGDCRSSSISHYHNTDLEKNIHNGYSSSTPRATVTPLRRNYQLFLTTRPWNTAFKGNRGIWMKQGLKNNVLGIKCPGRIWSAFLSKGTDRNRFIQ